LGVGSGSAVIPQWATIIDGKQIEELCGLVAVVTVGSVGLAWLFGWVAELTCVLRLTFAVSHFCNNPNATTRRSCGVNIDEGDPDPSPSPSPPTSHPYPNPSGFSVSWPLIVRNRVESWSASGSGQLRLLFALRQSRLAKLPDCLGNGEMFCHYANYEWDKRH